MQIAARAMHFLSGLSWNFHRWTLLVRITPQRITNRIANPYVSLIQPFQSAYLKVFDDGGVRVPKTPTPFQVADLDTRVYNRVNATLLTRIVPRVYSPTGEGASHPRIGNGQSQK